MGSDTTFRVLVVDESEAFLASTLNWIKARHDLRLVGVARTGPEALEAVERLSPDLLIVECVLQGFDGFRLARRIKTRDDAPLVLLVTFHASEAVRAEAHAAGADAFLAKYDLSDGLDSLLEGWRNGGRERAPQSRSPERPVRLGPRTVPDP